MNQNDSQKDAEMVLTTEDLKNAVTSKGGTTEAALNFLEAKEYSTIVKESIQKAADKSLEISNSII